jgi:hypothetical protein
MLYLYWLNASLQKDDKFPFALEQRKIKNGRGDFPNMKEEISTGNNKLKKEIFNERECVVLGKGDKERGILWRIT